MIHPSKAKTKELISEQISEAEKRRLRVDCNAQALVNQVGSRRRAASCQSLALLRGRERERKHRAASKIQAHARGVLARKDAAIIKAEMRVFGAFQVLVNELQQPEFEGARSNPIKSLASMLAEHVDATSKAAPY
ncbi:unnamed protein product [Discosporangium mesarthrocarpum]